MAYKELILPQKLSVDEKSMSDSYAKFVAEPYERGYGHTVGNALRRVLLSSLEGAAVTAVRIEKATHEYQALPGVKEDVMNLGRLPFQIDWSSRSKLRGPGEQTLGDLLRNLRDRLSHRLSRARSPTVGSEAGPSARR